MYHQRIEDGRQLISRNSYVADDCFQQELDLLFRQYWNFAGMADDIPNPGDFQCVQVGRYPLLIVRDKDTYGRFTTSADIAGCNFWRRRGTHQRVWSARITNGSTHSTEN